MLLLLPYSLLGLANFFERRHDATVRSARRTSENSSSRHLGEYQGKKKGRGCYYAPALSKVVVCSGLAAPASAAANATAATLTEAEVIIAKAAAVAFAS